MANLLNNLKLSEREYKKHLEKFLENKDFYNAAVCLNDLGNICLHRRDFKKAIGFYKRALKLKQIDHVVYDNLGTSYRELGYIKKAVAFYNEALKAEPRYELSLLNLEFSLMKLCDWDALSKYKFLRYRKTPFMSVITNDSPRDNLNIAKKWI